MYYIYIYIYIYIYHKNINSNVDISQNNSSIAFYTKATFAMRFLQTLQGQFSGFHFLICFHLSIASKCF